MHFCLALMMQAAWTGVCQAAIQHYPAAWGHYDVCKSQVYTDEGLIWDYMACQPEAADMTKYLKVSLDPPDITCGDPPETYCALVSIWKRRVKRKENKRKKKEGFLSVLVLCIYLACSDPTAMRETLKACVTQICGCS